MIRPAPLGLVVTTTLSALLALAGCGDNSAVCGPGTVDVDGVCTIGSGSDSNCGVGTVLSNGICIPGPTACGSGTMQGPSGQCVLDPTDCMDGTVLVGFDCVDPGRVSADLQEGPEPNDLGLLGGAPEGGSASAGTFTLKGIGSGAFVVHGTITPHAPTASDPATAPDIDAYEVMVTGPTAIQVSVQGLGDLEGGFEALPLGPIQNGDPLGGFRRVGTNLVGSTAKRQLVLPAAGTYVFAIADARTIELDGEAIDGSDMEYYASFTQIPMPTPTPITIAGFGSGSGSDAGSGNQITVQTGVLTAVSFAAQDGLTFLRLGPNTGTIIPAFGVYEDGGATYRTSADDGTDALAVGFGSGEIITAIIDPEKNPQFDPTVFTFDILTGSASPLSTTGGSVSEPVTLNSTAFTFEEKAHMNVWSYTVGSDNEALGMQLHFSDGVDGVIIDQNLDVITDFTNFDGSTFTDYNGYVVHLAQGTYYLLTDDPNAGSGAIVTATSTLAQAVTTPITLGTATAAQSVAFGTTAFTYTPDSVDHPWIGFAAAVTAGGANAVANGYDLTHTVGRLGSVDTTNGPRVPDPAPLFTNTVTSTVTSGHITLDDSTEPYFITMTPAAPTPSSKVAMTISDRAFTNLPQVAPNAIAAGGSNLFLVHGTLGDLVQITTALHGTAATPSVRVDSLNENEAVDHSFEDLAATAQLVSLLDQHGTAWVALDVTNLGAGGSFDVTATAEPGHGYTVTRPLPTSAIYPPFCAVGIPVDPTPDVTGDGSLFGPIGTPTGFTFFGVDAPTFTVSSAGWLSFANVTNSDADPAQIPSLSQPTQMIAGYWTSGITSAFVCVNKTPASTIVQFEGSSQTAFGNRGASIEFQVELDPTGQITITYNNNELDGMSDDGTDASIGIEDLGATSASEPVQFEQPLDLTHSIVFTPN